MICGNSYVNNNNNNMIIIIILMHMYDSDINNANMLHIIIIKCCVYGYI